MRAFAFVLLLLLTCPVLAQDDPDVEQTKRIEELIADLGDEDANVRWEAREALGKIGASAVPALITALSDEADDVRINAALALLRIGPVAAPAVPALTEALDDPDEKIKWIAAAVLARLHRGTVPALIKELDDPDPIVRWIAATALGNRASAAATAVPALTKALDDPDEEVRARATVSLGLVGVAAASAVPALIEMFDDPDENVRMQVPYALNILGPRLKANGTGLLWVVPRVYWREIILLLALLVAWFVLAARFPRHRPSSTPKHLALMAVTAAVPTALACSAVHYAITREWAQAFLPDTLTLVPFPAAAVLSTAFVCVLPAVWVCQRKQPQTAASEGRADSPSM